MINTLNRQIIGTGGGGASASIYVTGLQEYDSVTMTTPSGGSVVGVWDEVVNPNHIIPSQYTQLESITINGKGQKYGIKTNYKWKDVTSLRIVSKVNSRQVYNMVACTPTGANAYIGYQSNIASNGLSNLVSTPSVTASQLMSAIQDITYTFISTVDDYLCIQYYASDTQWSSNTTYELIEIKGNGIDTQLIPCVGGFYDTQANAMAQVYGSGGSFVNGEVIPTTIPCFRLLANEYGLHTITASNGVKTSTEEVLVDALMDYWVEMDYKLWLYKYGILKSPVINGSRIVGLSKTIPNGYESLHVIAKVVSQTNTSECLYMTSATTPFTESSTATNPSSLNILTSSMTSVTELTLNIGENRNIFIGTFGVNGWARAIDEMIDYLSISYSYSSYRANVSIYAVWLE